MNFEQYSGYSVRDMDVYMAGLEAANERADFVINGFRMDLAREVDVAQIGMLSAYMAGATLVKGEILQTLALVKQLQANKLEQVVEPRVATPIETGENQ